MKKTLLIIAVCLISTTTAFSQFQFGVGGTLGTKSSINKDDGALQLGFGPHVRALWSASEDIGVVVGVSYFLPTKIDEMSFNFMGANADLHFNFVKEEDSKIYGLGGISYTGLRGEFAGVSATEWAFGFHVGAGATFGKFFVEAKYEFERDFDGAKQEGQIGGTIGIYLN